MKRLIQKGHSISFYFLAFSFLLAITASCSKIENPDNDENQGTIEEYVAQTEDKLTVTTDLPAYVFPHNYEGFGVALNNRLKNKVSSFSSVNVESIATIVVHSSKLMSMGDDFGYLVGQLLMGNNVVIIEPTFESVSYFCKETTDWLQLIIEIDEEYGLNVERDNYPGLRQIFDGFYEMTQDDSKIKSLFISNTDDQGVFAEALAIRGYNFHIVDRITGTVESETTVTMLDSLTKTAVPVNAPQSDNPEKETVTPYTYGLFADVFTNWINKQANYREEVEELLTRGANTLESYAETTQYNLEDICAAQKVEYTFNAKTPYNLGSQLPITVSIEVLSVYMESQQSDYYCVYKKVISYNQKMGCGPQEEQGWRKAPEGYTEDEDERFWQDFYYGPFLSEIVSASGLHQTATSTFANSEGLVELKRDQSFTYPSNLKIEKYSPINSIGGTTETNGFTYGFNGGLCFGEKPSLNVGFNMSWTSSTSRVVSDLKCRASTYSNNGTLYFTYEGQNLPEVYFKFFGLLGHTYAPEILRTECVLDQSWIWRVPNPSGSYQMWDLIDPITCVMSSQVGLFYGITYYHKRDPYKMVSFYLSPPPRYVQKWSMIVEHSVDGEEGSDLDQKTLDAEIKTMHPDYWIQDGADIELADASQNSRVSITEFTNKFKQEMNNKRSTWEHKKLYGTFTFTYTNHDSQDKYKFRFRVNKSSDE